MLAHGAGHRQANVCVHVDLAHTVLDAALYLLDRDAVGSRHLAAVAVDDVYKFDRHRAEPCITMWQLGRRR